MQSFIISATISFLFFATLTLITPRNECGAKVNLTTDSTLASPLKSLKARARMDDEKAQLKLGNMYYRGRGGMRDYDKAYKWFKKAAEQGVAEAQYNLGLMYMRGESVGRDYILSYMWFNLASAGGYVRSIPELDSLEAKMTPAEVAKAQKLSRDFLSKELKEK